MPNFTELIWGGTGAVPLFVGAFLLYLASRAAAQSLSARSDLPGRRALGHWIPIAAAAIVAQQLKRSDLAITIVFASTVTYLSLVLGSVLTMAPGVDLPAGLRRPWLVILPAAFFIFLTGFSGHLSAEFAEAFLAFGVVILFFWIRLANSTENAPLRDNTPADSTEAPEFTKRPLILTVLNFFLAIALSLVGAFPAIHGIMRISGAHPTAMGVAPLTIISILGPLLAAPMLADEPALVHRKRGDVAMNACIGVALLNLCCLLPAIILLGSVQLNVADPFHPVILMSKDIPAIVFPVGLWQIDNVMLIILGFAILPAALGRWRYGKPEGMVLLAIYAVYLFMALNAYRPPLE